MRGPAAKQAVVFLLVEHHEKRSVPTFFKVSILITLSLEKSLNFGYKNLYERIL